MANASYDILEQLGDPRSVQTLQSRLNDRRTVDISGRLDQIETQIEKAVQENRSTEEVVRDIIQASFGTLNQEVEAAEKDLNELMLHLRAMLDSCGGEFAQLQELNDSEQALVDRAKAAFADAEKALAKAKDMPDLANLLFGMKNRRVKKMSQEVEEALAEIKQSEEAANKMYRDRLKNADIKDSLDRIISQVSGMIRIIEGMIGEVEGQIEALKLRKDIAFETKEKAARVMEERQSDLDDIEARLRQAELQLEEFGNATPEHTEQQKKIADLREQRAEIKGRYHIALGIFQSKERFVEQIVVHLEAQTITKNNLKQLIGQLRSDTEERITTYSSGLQLIQSATAQEAASIYEEAGVKTDQLITEIAAKVFVSSERDRIERIRKHPSRMEQLHQVLVAMAQATQRFKEQDAQLAEQYRNKYGIDVGKEFSFRYETAGAEDGAKTSAAGSPAPQGQSGAKPGLGSTDSLLE
jgi:chromosome segregation ATPase